MPLFSITYVHFLVQSNKVKYLCIGKSFWATEYFFLFFYHLYLYICYEQQLIGYLHTYHVTHMPFCASIAQTGRFVLFTVRGLEGQCYSWVLLGRLNFLDLKHMFDYRGRQDIHMRLNMLLGSVFQFTMR